MKAAHVRMLLAIAALGLTAAGCAEVDSEGQLEEYGQRVDQASDASFDGVGPEGTCTPTGDADLTGNYFLGIGASLLGGQAINFKLNVAEDGDDYTFTLQALAKDSCPGGDRCGDAIAREPVGDPVVISGVTYENDGIITLTATDEVVVAEEANSGSTGGTINIKDLKLNLLACEGDYICGGDPDTEIKLDLTKPLDVPGLPATVGAIKSEEVSTEAFDIAPRTCGEINSYVDSE